MGTFSITKDLETNNLSEEKIFSVLNEIVNGNNVANI